MTAPIKTITRVEISSLFWDDLTDLRSHPDYRKLRASIAATIQSMARGENAGDRAFQGRDIWGSIRHKHIGSKLILFLVYPDADTVRLCAIKKHDFYGFRRERKSRVEDAARKIGNAAASPHTPSPNWPSLKWTDPGAIAQHIELRELSREGLSSLYQEVLEEIDTLALPCQRIEGMSDKLARSFTDGWFEGLEEAQSAIEDQLCELARKAKPHFSPKAFETW